MPGHGQRAATPRARPMEWNNTSRAWTASKSLAGQAVASSGPKVTPGSRKRPGVSRDSSVSQGGLTSPSR